MKNLIGLIIMFFAGCSAFAANPYTGCWTTIDDETKTPKSVVQIYEYQGKYYGRVVDIIGNKEAVAALPGSPKILGLDIIREMTPVKDKLKNGTITDPKKGKTYDCEMWRDGDNLIVRGKIAFLGRNQTWLPNSSFKPIENLIPQQPLK